MTKYVWRVQNVDGNGPCAGTVKGTFDKWSELETHNATNGHPEWHEDAVNPNDIDLFYKNDNWQKYRFGFTSYKQLRRWFSLKELCTLATLGFKPIKVEASEIYKGRHQIMFVPKRAKDLITFVFPEAK